MSWWEYATGTEKALIVVGVVALALLAIVVASPHVRLLQPIANSLGLVSVETVYVPINHTVYVNKTVYVNRTIYIPVVINRTVVKPVYINRTVYVPVPTNETINVTMGIPIYNDTGTCSLYSLVLPNGTIWTLGYWIPTQWAWNLILSNGTIMMWGKFPVVPYGQSWYNEIALYVVFPGLGTAYIGGVQIMVNMPNKPMPNWVNMIYMGDWAGGGPIMYESDDYWGVNNGTAVMLNTWTWVLKNYTSIVLPVNNTYPVVLVFMSYPTNQPSLAIPCNWTFIGPVNPQVAVMLPMPMGYELAYEAHYVNTGSTTYPQYEVTWGFAVWRLRYPPLNVSNLPWPVG